MTSIKINVEIPDQMIEDIIDTATIGYWGRIYRGTDRLGEPIPEGCIEVSELEDESFDWRGRHERWVDYRLRYETIALALQKIANEDIPVAESYRQRIAQVVMSAQWGEWDFDSEECDIILQVAALDEVRYS